MTTSRTRHTTPANTTLTLAPNRTRRTAPHAPNAGRAGNTKGAQICLILLLLQRLLSYCGGRQRPLFIVVVVDGRRSEHVLRRDVATYLYTVTTLLNNRVGADDLRLLLR